MADVKIEHPSAERLAAFRLGRLPVQEHGATEAHLALCDACRQELSSLSDATLLWVMRQPATGAVAAGPSPAGIPAELARHPRYRVLQLLGRGGMGAVYKAEHQLMQRLVALKVIDQGLTGDPASVERFRREVIAAARLTHPNIVTALDAEQIGNLHFLVMEYVEGENLAELVSQRMSLPVPQACSHVAQAAAGLQHAHERGMVHRDIKPHNLMLTPQGGVKVLDFGLACFVSERASHGGLTQPGTLMGTPDYIAPEQSEDPRKADIRADIYSLGCTVYFLLAGQPPFPEGTLIQKIRAHMERTPVSLRQLRPDVPPALEQAVARMMAKRPEQRYQTPAEVIQALAPFHGAGRGPGTAPAAPGRPPGMAVPRPPAGTVPAGPTPASPPVPAGPGRSGPTDDPPPPAADAELPPRKVLPVVLGAVGLVVVVVGLVAAMVLHGLTETGPTQAEAQAPPPSAAVAASYPSRSTAPVASARSPQSAWPLELVQQSKVPAPDMSGLPILFNANFHESDNGFWVGTAEEQEGIYRSEYRDGKLRLTSPPGLGNFRWWSLPGYQSHSNFACEMVGRVVRPRTAGWGCVLIGEKGRGVLVSIDSEGALHLQTLATARNPISVDTGPLDRAFLHRAIKARGEANVLLCVVRGRQLELYVNGVAVQNPLPCDVDLAPAGIAYIVLGGPDGCEVELERITLWSVEDLPPPEARTVPGR
jgi:hypothetical protein